MMRGQSDLREQPTRKGATPERAREPFLFGELLREFRLAAGLSQQALAERAGLSTIGVGALERGDRRAPYRETVALLAAALGLSTDDRTRLEVAAHRPRHLGRRVSTAAANTRAAEPNSLPSSLTALIGRDIDVREISALTLEHRLVTVTGTGGIGKTRTALQVGSNLSEAGCHVCFVELAPRGEASSIVAAIAAALGIEESPNRALLQTLLARLKRSRLTLILDNCEHVISEAAVVAETLLRGCQKLRILTTSREPLRVAGEQTYRLPSLTAPSFDACARLSARAGATYGAIALFVDRARAVEHRFALTDENAPIVGELCRRLDGIPLALELAAVRVKIVSVKGLLEKLDERLRVLTSNDRLALGRHQTMQALIDWSYDFLCEKERKLFRCLSIFAGGCTMVAVTAVCVAPQDGSLDPTSAYREFSTSDGACEFEVMELLCSLVDKSLLLADVDGYEPRYRLLESMKRYAREKLILHHESIDVAHRHARTYLALAQRLEHAYDMGEDWEWRAQTEPELENFRTALEWSLIARGDKLLGQRLVGTLHQVWTNFTLVEGRRWTHAALDAVDASTPASVIAKLQYAESYIASWLGHHETVVSAGFRALTSYRALQDSIGITRALQLVGVSLVFLGRAVEGEPLLEEALHAARTLGGRRLLSRVLQCAALARHAKRDAAGARDLFSEALAVYGGSFARATQVLAGVAAKENDPVRAARLLGFCDARRAATDQRRYPNEQYGYERLRDLLFAALGEQDVVAKMAEGGTFHDQRAIEEAFPT